MQIRSSHSPAISTDPARVTHEELTGGDNLPEGPRNRNSCVISDAHNDMQRSAAIDMASILPNLLVFLFRVESLKPYSKSVLTKWGFL